MQAASDSELWREAFATEAAHVTEPGLTLSALDMSQMFFPWWQSRKKEKKKLAEVLTQLQAMVAD